MNPWKIIGWIVLGFLLLVIYSCGKVAMDYAEQQEALESGRPIPRATPAPSHQLTVIRMECIDRGRGHLDVTVRNDGPTEIPYAKAFGNFYVGDGSVLSADDSYFNPSTIPRGSFASAKVFSDTAGWVKCGLATVQDTDGNPVSLTWE